MDLDHEAKARNLVAAFLDVLDESARQAITPAHVKDLEQLLSEALAEAVGDALQRMEETLRQLRAANEKSEIGL